MKVCIISHNFPPVICGVGDYSHWLTNELGKQGNDVSVITSKLIKSLGHRAIEPSGQVKVFPVVEKWDVFHIFKIIEVLESIKPDIVIIQYVCQLYGRAGIAPGIVALPILLKLVVGQPRELPLHIGQKERINHREHRGHRKKKKLGVITTFHELYIPWGLKDFLLGVIQRVQAFLLAFFSDACIVTAESRRETLRLLFPWKKIYKIPVGSNIPSSEYQNTRVSEYQSSPLVLSTFGTLHPERDLLTVFEALAIIQNSEFRIQKLEDLSSVICHLSSVILWVIGNVDKNSFNYKVLKSETQKLGIEGRINWFCGIPAGEVARCLASSDVYLSPELGGASGRRGTLMAALSFGLPVIAYQGKDTESVFKNNENIIFVPPRNPEILAQEIELLIKNKELRITLGKKAKETFETYFSWDIIGKEYEKVFKAIT